MRDLIILGTGVHSGEMAEIVERVNGVKPTWNLLGHVAPKDGDPGESPSGKPVLGGSEVIGRYPGALLVPDNEFPRDRLKGIPLERFASLIDPQVFVSGSARIGAGCVFYPHGFIGLRAKVGDFVFALAGVVVNHDDVIEDRVVMASNCTLAGYVRVEADSYLGQSCSIRQYLSVGRKSLIGMGAVVVRDVPPFSVMAGNPARRLREVPDKDRV